MLRAGAGNIILVVSVLNFGTWVRQSFNKSQHKDKLFFKLSPEVIVHRFTNWSTEVEYLESTCDYFAKDSTRTGLGGLSFDYLKLIKCPKHQ